ncbi:LOW QUALITY PROTEIN: protein phosphatase 1, regulatory (inhibitor) subunit 14Aa [Phycodurus eques]|uniref:LOW QUALITY PROTEIN: protein phosphatase 1, regulatory (inhibitor) subunit 14Aa n=1 Tax=Phycodurus eques TaxID=693459 RepID=UPI002ACD3B74|nr:LOW QUALITY PROTEIN: protein phosphatase 1, regulatory (inhibitor) subunit 14Aa [Phycodurus eques]
MAADRTGTTLGERENALLADEGPFEEHGVMPLKRHARVTVKYNRKELQRRLDVEKWIDERLDVLYAGQEGDMPEEVTIDDLIDLPDDVERVKKLQELLQTCNNDTETFITELIEKLEGVHKEEALQSEGVEHPVISHSHHRHEPYHFNNPHRAPHTRGQNQTL